MTDFTADPSVGQTRGTIADWLGLIRFSHTIFALPFAALSTILAFTTPLGSGQYPAIRFQDLLGILCCMVFARSAAMAFNRLTDQRFDAENPRTATRHLPSGRLTRPRVWAFVLLTSVGFVNSTLLFLPNTVPLAASLPVLAFLLGYSLAKRFTIAAHLWLGAALSLAPICAWVAIRGVDSNLGMSDLMLPIILAGVVASWVTGFDIIYACQDADFDARAGLHSIPGALGVPMALRIAALSHLVMIVLLCVLAYVGRIAGLSWVFAGAVAMTSILVVVQHRLVSPGQLTRVNEAFFNTNAAISLILLIAGALDCWLT